jgi:hypothetical protein
LSRAVPYELPAHAVAAGAPLPAFPLPGFAELARYFANAEPLLRAITQGRPGAAPVRCWPHHFDLGTLLTHAGVGGDDVSTVGLGLSPGDEGYPEPYFYVTLWPHPRGLPEVLPALPGGGHWHREGWDGAVLPGTRLVETPGARDQEALARDFLVSAVRVARGLLGLPEP